jgi:hypothetical protein
MSATNTRIDLDRVDYSQGRDLLSEFLSGDRQCIPASWNEFFDIPLTQGYEANKNREFDFAKLRDMSNNDIQVTVTPAANVDPQPHQ